MRRNAEGAMVPMTRIETDWYFASGRVFVRFDDETRARVAQHSRAPRRCARAAGTRRAWCPRRTTYLAGLHRGGVSGGLEPAFAEAKQRFARVIDSAVRADIGGTSSACSA
jgi:hypothetical protein